MLYLNNSCAKIWHANYKGMKKLICITPADEDTQVLTEALRIVNDFKILGYRREDFFRLVIDRLPDYDTMDGVKKLTGYWLLRVKDPELNEQLSEMLLNIKVRKS
jgi:hypothetical protein